MNNGLISALNTDIVNLFVRLLLIRYYIEMSYANNYKDGLIDTPCSDRIEPVIMHDSSNYYNEN